MTYRIGSHGEVAEFEDKVKVTKLIYKGFGIDQIAINHNVDLCLTVDGFCMTNNLAFVMGGIKMVDPRCVNPLTGKKDIYPLAKKKLPQISNFCFSYKIVTGQETAQMYKEEFEDLFNFSTKLA